MTHSVMQGGRVLNLGRLDFFPLQVSISVGRNPLFWPLMHASHITSVI